MELIGDPVRLERLACDCIRSLLANGEGRTVAVIGHYALSELEKLAREKCDSLRAQCVQYAKDSLEAAQKLGDA
jgi:hypothetical protein